MNVPTEEKKFTQWKKVLPLFILLLLTSCNCCCPWPDPDLLRRPQVMRCWPECTLDFNPVLDEFDTLLSENECDSSDKPVPLTADMFEPFKPTEDNFILSTGDFVALAVFGDEDTIADEVCVAPDGRIYYSVLNEGVPAAGRNIPDVRADFEKLLAKFFVDPVVNLSAKTSISDTYSILGRVTLPGVYSTTDPLRLREAIGNAGGLLKEDFTGRNETINPEESLADLAHSFIIRKGRKLEVDFHDLYYNPATKYDIFIHPGDYIYIAATPFQEVYVLGAVSQPRRVRYDKRMTLMDALGEAGGWPIGNPYSADVSRCVVIRGCLESPLYVEIDLSEIYFGKANDILLQAGDIIYLYNKTLRFGRQVALLALNAFVQAFGASAAGYYAQFVWFRISQGGTDVD